MSFSDSDGTAVGDGTIRYAVDNSTNHNLLDLSFLATAEQDSPLTLNFTHSNNLDSHLPTSMQLAWTQDTPAGAPFILSGADSPGAFSSTNMPVDWMHQNLAGIGCQPLRRLSIPGSHDTGMSTLTGGTFLTTEDNTLTQWVDVAGQLNAGFRYFDIRPVIASGIFTTGHYSQILDEWVGGNGQDLASVIAQVNQFTSQNNELIILDLSHMYNTDDNWRALNNAEFTTLVKQLQGINHLYTSPTPSSGDLSTLPLNTFISASASVIVLLASPPIPLPPGLFPESALPIYNSYSDTADPKSMAADQLSKLSIQRKSRDSSMFLLSWTLTTIANIRQLATQAHSLLFDPSDQGLWKTIYNNRASGAGYPNIVFIDGIGQAAPSVIGGSNVAAFCMGINHVVLEGVSCPS